MKIKSIKIRDSLFGLKHARRFSNIGNTLIALYECGPLPRYAILLNSFNATKGVPNQLLNQMLKIVILIL